ncbi:putative 2-dehydropantoate 2-reductase [compost metagenome]
MNNRIYHKLLINAVLNPLTALFDVKNGELPAHPTRMALMRALYEETALILKGAGMQLESDGWAQIIEVCERTSGNVSSMLSDVRAGRKTEIGAINGAVVRLAEQQQLKAPCNRAVMELVDALSKRSKMGE